VTATPGRHPRSVHRGRGRGPCRRLTFRPSSATRGRPVPGRGFARPGHSARADDSPWRSTCRLAARKGGWFRDVRPLASHRGPMGGSRFSPAFAPAANRLGGFQDARPPRRSSTADGTTRRASVPFRLKPQLDEGAEGHAPGRGARRPWVDKRRRGRSTLEPAADVEWAELLAAGPRTRKIEPTSASDVLLLAYNLPGRPAGRRARCTPMPAFPRQGGQRGSPTAFRAPQPWAGRSLLDHRHGGWIMGAACRSSARIALAAAPLLLYEGSPDVPDTSRLLAPRRAATACSMLGVSPTLVRTFAGRRPPIRPVTCRQSGFWDRQASRGTRSPTSGLARDVFGGKGSGDQLLRRHRGGRFVPVPLPGGSRIHSCSLGGPAPGPWTLNVVDDKRPAAAAGSVR